MNKYLVDPRFAGIVPFEKKMWLASPTMHGDEQRWVDDAIQTNWVSTVGANINEVEKQVAAYIGCKHAVALSCGTAALHLATKLAGERLYGMPRPNEGTLQGKRVFCSDVTFDASINPVAYEDGEAVFIDTERDTWNMDPEALKKVLRDGHLGAVALDVTEPEPLPTDHPLWDEPRCFITPHQAGGSFGKCDGTEERICEVCCENLRRFVAGEELTHLVL
jgi:dTDP-4-amino-4,6-dideoxygalactose transaminase